MAQKEAEINSTKLYNALVKGNELEAIKYCKEMEEGPLQTLTIHNDTVLHIASYCNRKNLIINLLDCLSPPNWSKLVYQNKMGNTVLHEAASLYGLVPAAEAMLSKCSEMLAVRNSCGETAVFQAARYGAIDMYRFLDTQIINSKQDFKDFHVRNDKTNILHISILAEHFDLAYLIVSNQQYVKYLAKAKDGAGRTALQLLACNSSVFLSGSKSSTFKKFFYKYVPCQDTDEGAEVKTGCRVPLFEAIRSKKSKYLRAIEVAKVLIEEETCWDNIEPNTDGNIPTSNPLNTGAKDPGNPLILATKSGCTEIVKEILAKHPHAVEHVDGEGNNMLQVAIKYRRIEIFKLVMKKMAVPAKRLVRKIDNDGNSLLHLVGIKEHHDDEAADMRSPVLRLQEVLLLFERVKKISTAHFVNRENSKGQTAEKILEKSTAQLRNDAKEWTTRTATNCSIVSVLIATVAFAAMYQPPGGLNDAGYPKFLNETTGFAFHKSRAFFITFTVGDVLSLAFSLSSVVLFLSILTSPFRLRDFKQHLPRKLMIGVTLLVLSISMLMLAFAATILLTMIHGRFKKSTIVKIVIYFVAFVPVLIFILSYLSLYVSLMKSFIYSLKKVGPAFPRYSREHSSTSENRCIF